MKVVGYEKFWAAILGGAMSSAVITFALWGFSVASGGAVEAPGPEAITAGITGIITTLFSAALVYLTATTGATEAIDPANPNPET